MNFKLPSIIAFIICQVYTAWAQQQGANPTQALLPGSWVYSGAADAWREYFIRAQQATNQLYQQWANMSGNPLSNAMGGLGGLYGIGNTAQPGSSNQPPRPLQGFFNVVTPPQSGLQLSELLLANVRAGKQDAKGQASLQDQIQGAKPQTVVQQQEVPVKPQNQVTPSQIIQPSVQEVPLVQPQSAETQAPQPQAQQQISLPFQIPGVPFQTVGQATSPIQPSVGLFGSSNPLGWMG